MKQIRTTSLLALFACIPSAPLAGQWLNQPTAGIPRNADGKPNLTAPAPRAADGHPDLSGFWRSNWKGIFDVTPDLKPGDIAPWAQALVEQRGEDLAKDYMAVLCLPEGPAFPNSLMEAKIIQTSSLVAVLHPDLTYRQIFMDGRALESDPNPTWMGYSVGRWENDTLVVESAGFNGRTWLDRDGHPHTEGLRTTERYRRVNFGRMELLLTYEDPAVYAKPFTVKIDMSLAADTEMLEYVCNENEKDRAHMIGQASDLQKHAVELSSETLAKYAGNYQMGSQGVVVSLEQGQLKVSFSGGGMLSLIPFSETSFYYSTNSSNLNFQSDTDGAITGFTMGAQRAVRIK
ncbi:MAG: hypothetical protein ABI995_10285 [Acidobacteriota bacterium]